MSIQQLYGENFYAARGLPAINRAVPRNER